MIGLPLVVYTMCFVPTLVRFRDSSIGRELCGRTHECRPSLVSEVRAIVSNQRAVLHFHETLVPHNRYAVNAASWIFQTAPTGLLSSDCPSPDPVCSAGDPSSTRRIIGIGTPVVWMLGTVALCFALLVSLWRLDLRRGLVAAWAAALWVPWVVRPVLSWLPIAAARPGYTFYAAPLVPVIGVALASAWAELRGRRRTVIGIALAVTVLAGAVVLYPVWTARAVSPTYLRDLVSP
jgi:dolichyl-phosphate-mannose--protein O-mannosyl transferase